MAAARRGASTVARRESVDSSAVGGRLRQRGGRPSTTAEKGDDGGEEGGVDNGAEGVATAADCGVGVFSLHKRRIEVGATGANRGRVAYSWGGKFTLKVRPSFCLHFILFRSRDRRRIELGATGANRGRVAYSRGGKFTMKVRPSFCLHFMLFRSIYI
jgi:hypothetical protein